MGDGGRVHLLVDSRSVPPEPVAWVLPGYAGRLFDYFVARPDHHRPITWGRLDPPGTAAVADDPTQAVITRKIGQLREVQLAGQLDPAWGPADVLALVNQIAMTWAAQPELSEAAAANAVDPTAARRAAVVTTVERLFPRARRGPRGPSMTRSQVAG
ncbi:hypothetical protein ACH4MN_16045 [Streptomyces anulatus]|uniref:hypothetical protein n=1 Tax=Streptomyces anulatus TaxID=1892 RepID=UPI0033E7BD27